MENQYDSYFRELPAKSRMFLVFTPQSIQESALFVFKVTKRELESETRIQNVVFCRHAIAGLIEKYTALSQREISLYAGNRTRSNISNSIDVFKALCGTHKAFAEKIINVEQRLEGVCA